MRMMKVVSGERCVISLKKILNCDLRKKGVMDGVEQLIFGIFVF